MTDWDDYVRNPREYAMSLEESGGAPSLDMLRDALNWMTCDECAE